MVGFVSQLDKNKAATFVANVAALEKVPLPVGDVLQVSFFDRMNRIFRMVSASPTCSIKSRLFPILSRRRSWLYPKNPAHLVKKINPVTLNPNVLD